MGSPCLFRERYEFLPAWDVTRRCLPGGNSRRGDPSPEGGTGPGGGVRGSARAAASSRSTSSSRPVSGSARPGGATGSRPRCGGAASRRAARPAAPPMPRPRRSARAAPRHRPGHAPQTGRPGCSCCSRACAAQLGNESTYDRSHLALAGRSRPLRWQQHRRGRDRRSGSGRHQKSAVGRADRRLPGCRAVRGRQSGERRSSRQACASSLTFSTWIVAFHVDLAPGSGPASQRSVPPSGRRDKAVEEQAFVIRALIPHRGLRCLTAVRALCLDPLIVVQGSADAECVPCAIAVPPPPGSLDPVGGWDAGERFAILMSVVTGLRTRACSAWSRSQPV